ncbi:MAG: trehalase family glycosidase, partial [Phycisphaeraceae bacterium]|nr:trehalase family glycosidase [Phycisphaeraceae bacterium]
VDLLPELIDNYRAWEASHRDDTGLVWQMDDRDGLECSISGRLSPDHTGYRATINSYMFGDARAIARIADWAGDVEVAEDFRQRAGQIRERVQARLWDDAASFYKTLPRVDDPTLADVRELHGYTPWYFDLPEVEQAKAWAQLMDPDGFFAPFGPTTAEQRHPDFAVTYDGHPCKWDGPSWPFATSVTLTGMANLLHNQQQDVVDRHDYFQVLRTYAQCHRRTRGDGRTVPWIDENLDPFTGRWLARDIQQRRKAENPDDGSPEEVGKDYNHSTFCDLVIDGLLGIRPEADGTCVIHPLVPDSWDYFGLDGLVVHGKRLSVRWDRAGERYGGKPGLGVWADSEQLVLSPTIERLTVSLM